MIETGFVAIMRRSVLQMVRRPIYWIAMLALPLFLILFMTSEMESGLPEKVPAGIVDRDGTQMSRGLSQTLGGMQSVSVVRDCNDFTEARRAMQEGKIFGFFLIPENFQADLMAGRAPVVSFYTNMTYYVPASLLFKSFKSTSVYTKAGLVMNVLESVGADELTVTPLVNPVNVTVRGLGNPWLNYGYYLCNSFLPGVMQLMIILVTCYSLGQELKYGTSVRLMRMAGGNVYKGVLAKLIPQSLVWVVLMLFLESWFYRWMHYPMHGSWFWLTVSGVMFVFASQGFAVFLFCVLPNLRFSLSIGALLGVLSFSLAAFSFPVESMYPAIGIFSWILPVRYNFLIYIDQALNGIDIWYSRWWYLAYLVFMLLPLTMLWRVRRRFEDPVYLP